MHNFDSVSVCGTFSRSPLMWGFEKGLTAESGKGVYVRLSDGKTYTDWPCGLGPNILGYSNNAFDSRMMMYLRRGVSFSLQSSMEFEAADKLTYLLGKHVKGWVPNDISVRWAMTGTDANIMAVRLARAVTGKHHIVRPKGSYHGWSDWGISTAPPALGLIPEISGYVLECNYGDMSGLGEIGEEHRGDIAAVILEHPVGKPVDGWYQYLRSFCNDHNALLVVDEVVTGLRYSLGGACELHGIEPDLATYGKAIGNGIPVAALVGRRPLMGWFARESPVFCSGTYNGNALSCAAVSAVLDMWGQADVDYIWRLGEKLIAGMNDAGWRCIGDPPRSVVVHEDERERAYFISGMRRHGILMNRPNFICRAHTESDVVKTCKAAKELRQEMDALSDEELTAATMDKMPRVLFKNR